MIQKAHNKIHWLGFAQMATVFEAGVSPYIFYTNHRSEEIMVIKEKLNILKSLLLFYNGMELL